MKTTSFYLYAHYAPCFINDDCSHLSDADEVELDELKEELTEQLGEGWRCVGVEDFCISYPELGKDRLLGEVAEFVFNYKP